LPGIIVDDATAKFSGKWQTANKLTPFVGSGYHYAKGENAEARFAFSVSKAGRYELRLSWAGHENRAAQVPCVIERGNETLLKLRLNQQENTADPKGFHSLGIFDFEPGKTNAVVLATAGADGYVHADCLQVIEAKP
jgi:hypothetical protein